MKIGFIVATLSFFVVVIVLAFVFRAEKSLSVVNESTSDNPVVLTVPPQKVDTTVFIERVDLPKAGFIAVRSLENGRLGQIVEISPYFTTGIHTNISISLGDFYDGSSDLIVVAYNDSGDDKVFNDLDQPLLQSDGTVVAVYASSGEAVPSDLFSATAESTPHVMGGMAMEIVRYTNTGYEPNRMVVSSGTIVQFVNESDNQMWVASNDHPGHTDLPTFDQFTASAKETTYTYVFDELGEWKYHDHLLPTFEGVIVVE